MNHLKPCYTVTLLNLKTKAKKSAQLSCPNLQMCCRRTYQSFFATMIPGWVYLQCSLDATSCYILLAFAIGDPGRANVKILVASTSVIFSRHCQVRKGRTVPEEAAEFVTSLCLSVTTSWSLPHGPYLEACKGRKRNQDKI